MNICVIGLGSMGRRRIRLLKSVAADSIIVGVEKNLERRKSVAEEYEIECYSALSDVKEEVNCAFVCTSPQFHAEITRACLERGMHVFSEINLISDLYEENICMAEEKRKYCFFHPLRYISGKCK